jgi:hypothetical protein
MNKQEELAEQIAGILYKNKTDEADEGSWIESKDFYKVAVAIVEAMDAPAKEGMKWVKASERLPDNEGIYKVKRVHSEGIETGEFICGAFTNYYGYRVMEWLDESASSSNEDYVASNSAPSTTDENTEGRV